MIVRKVFGIPFSPSHMTDEEYVEWVRHNLRLEKKMAWFPFVVGLFMLGSGFWLLLKFEDHLQRMTNDILIEKGLYIDQGHMGLVFGMSVGFVIGLMWFFGVLSMGSGLKSAMGRNAKLLIKYHDELKSSGKK